MLSTLSIGQRLNEEIFQGLFVGHIMKEEIIIKMKDYSGFSTHSLIQIDSTFFRSDGVKTIILAHKLFNTDGWIASGLKSTDPAPNEQINLAQPIWKYHSQKNYFFEVDSAGHVIYTFSFDQTGKIITYFNDGYIPDTSPPAIFEYSYNKNGLLEYVQAHNRFFGVANEWRNACALKFKWRDSTLKEIQYHNLYRQTGEWILSEERIKDFPLIEPVNETKRQKIISIGNQAKRKIDSILSSFPNDTLLTNCYWRNSPFEFYHDSVYQNSCPYLVLKIPNNIILSDTIDDVIRYIWLLPDGHSYTFYTKDKKLIKVMPYHHPVSVRNEENKRVTYPLTVSCYRINRKSYLYEEYLEIPEDDEITSFYDASYISYKKHAVLTPENLETYLMNHFCWYDQEFKSFMHERIYLNYSDLFSNYQKAYENMLQLIKNN